MKECMHLTINCQREILPWKMITITFCIKWKSVVMKDVLFRQSVFCTTFSETVAVDVNWRISTEVVRTCHHADPGPLADGLPS
jgi:hypothetical protein